MVKRSSHINSTYFFFNRRAEKAANMYRAKSITVFTKDRQGIYAQLKGDEVKVGDKIVTGGQQNLSNGALVSVADKAGVGTEQPANKTNL